jgi:hypothetical protein
MGPVPSVQLAILALPLGELHINFIFGSKVSPYLLVEGSAILVLDAAFLIYKNNFAGLIFSN